MVKYSRGKVFLEELGGSVRPEVAFREDRRGEDKLMKAQGLPAFSVARYKVRARFALGMQREEEERKRRERQKPLRFFSKAFLRPFLAQEGIVSLPTRGRKQKGPLPGPTDDVILLGAADPPGDAEGSDPLSIYDPSTVSYLAGEGPRGKEEEDSQEESFKLHYVQERTKEFNERLRAEPENVDLWLEFVDFQDVSFQDAEFSAGGDTEGGGRKRKAARNVVMKRNALVEKKLAVLKSALDRNPKNTDLAVKRLELSREVLETSVLDRQWKELIFLFPKNFELWRYYLRFASSYFTSFSVSKVVRAYRTCFAKLREVQSQSFLSPDRPEDLERQMRIIFASLCHFMARAGYREKGVALFQAMLELNLFSPDFPGYYSLEDRMALFEPFWESGVPRIGEPGMAGWRTVMKNKGTGQDPAEDFPTASPEWEEEEEEALEKAGGLVGRNSLWLELELGRERHHWLPWRSSEEDADDPDRTVPYEDVSPFVFQFNEPEQILCLLVNFVDFLGVTFDDQAFFPTTVASETVSTTLLGSHTVETLSPDVDLQPDVLAPVLQRTSPDVVEDQKFQTFCRNVFAHSLRCLKEPSRTAAISLWLRFELRVFEETTFTTAEERKRKSKEIKGLVKNLLQDDQKNLDVYIEYANLEYRADGFKSAWRILQSAMASQEGGVSLSLYTSGASIALGELMRTGDSSFTDLAVWLLTLAGLGKSYTSRESVSRTMLLDLAAQAKETSRMDVEGRLAAGKFVGDGEEASLTLNPVNFVPSLVRQTFICSWLTFFADGSPGGAVRIVDSALERMKGMAKGEEFRTAAVRLTVENLHKIKVDLLSLASETSKMVMQSCRRGLQDALADSPCSRYFLQQLCAMHVQPSVVDATWRGFVNTALSSIHLPSSLPQIYAVKVLVKHFVSCQKAGSGEEGSAADDSQVAHTYLHRAKALLERFVSREPGRYSPAVWRLLLWVTATLEGARSQGGGGGTGPSSLATSTVFYRSLQDCPAGKALYLDFARHALVGGGGRDVDGGAQEELKKVLDILVEKEGRTRLPLEELEVLLEKEDGMSGDEQEESAERQ